MNIVFMGTSKFAVPVLRALAIGLDKGEQAYSVKLVVTRPDAASGRGKALIPSPVRVYAEELAIPVITPQKVSFNAELESHIASLEPDFIVVAAYGKIIPQQILDIPRFGCVNIHASLLPRWRGAAPIQRAILAGDAVTGVSIMRMEAGLDTGAVCSFAVTPLAGRNARELTAELASKGAELLLEALPGIQSGTVTWLEQPEEGVTYADKVDKAELALSPAVSVQTNIRRVLASTLQAPARCLIGERVARSVTILGAEPVTSGVEARIDTSAPGRVFSLNNQLIFTTVDGSFAVTSLKPDGKKAMDAGAFVAGFRELQKGSQTSVSWSAIERELL